MTWGSMLVRALAALASCATAAADTYVTVQPDPAHGDGTLWFQSFGGSGSGGTQLAGYELHGGGLDGIYSIALIWNNSHLYTVAFKDNAITGFAEVLVGGNAVTNCLGVASFSGGFIVTETAGAPTAIRPHVGALFWSPSAAIGGPGLFAVEVMNVPGVAGAVQAQRILAGSFKGATVLASKLDDTDPAPGGLASHLVASVLAYTSGNVFLCGTDMSETAPIASTTSILSVAGAAITNLLGCAVLNSGFNLAAAPDVPEGAALLWSSSQVLQFEHRSTGDTLTSVLNPATGGALTGCWGVLPLYGSDDRGPLPAAGSALKQAYCVFTTSKVYVGTGASLAEFSLNDGSFSTDVVIGASPLIQRQATHLYELMGRSSLAADATRGMVIGLNQRSR